jgi:hypothetical protein
MAEAFAIHGSDVQRGVRGIGGVLERTAEALAELSR